MLAIFFFIEWNTFGPIDNCYYSYQGFISRYNCLIEIVANFFMYDLNNAIGSVFLRSHFRLWLETLTLHQVGEYFRFRRSLPLFFCVVDGLDLHNYEYTHSTWLSCQGEPLSQVQVCCAITIIIIMCTCSCLKTPVSFTCSVCWRKLTDFIFSHVDACMRQRHDFPVQLLRNQPIM